MKHSLTAQDGWSQLLTRLSEYTDLDKGARQYGALSRSRKIKNASDLLRLIFGYCACNMSLRSTASWAQLQSIADVSDVAIFKRVRQALPWLQHILSSILNAGLEVFPSSFTNRQVFLVDTTYLKVFGSQKNCWKLHTAFHLNTQTIRMPHLTQDKAAETLERHTIEEGGIYVADRAYARTKQVQYVTEHKADFIVRAGFQTFTLREEDGSKFVLTERFRSLPKDEPVEFTVWLAKNHRCPEITGSARLIAIRNTEDARQRTMLRVKRKAHKNGTKRPHPDTMELANYFFVLTSLPKEYSPEAVLRLYRMRWQIELAFKRLKSLFNIDSFRAKGTELTQCHILVGLIFSLLTDKATRQVIATGVPPEDGRQWSLWRLQRHILSAFKTDILGLLGADSFFRNLTRIRRKLCEPPRLRKAQANWAFSLSHSLS